MKKTIIPILLSLVILTLSVTGQDKQRIIPPSPQAQQFMKFIDYPVDYSSGLPKIDIPVYTIQCGDLTLPISINYHSTGLKPSEDTGFIGLGWSLNYGGIISRTMKGYPDEKFYSSPIRNESEYTSSSDQQVIDPYNYELVSTINGFKDTQYDIFYYSIPSQQGRFIFKRNSDINLFKQPVLLPYHPIKILPNDGFNYFDVTDDKGVSYRFGRSLKSSIDEIEFYRAATNPTNAETGTSAWLLTEIISTDKSDTISFEYEFVKVTDISNLITKTHKSFSRSWSQYLGGGDQSYPNTYSTPSSTSAYEYTTKRIKTIKFKKNEIRFSYSSASYPNSFLTTIQIFDKASASIIQSVELTRTQYHSDATKLNWYKLDLIQYKDKNSQPVKKYQFSYDNSVAFPPIDILATNETSAVDFWGYYNTSCCNNDMIPPNSLYFDGQGINRLTGNANRNANSVWSKLGMLTQIIYPEGGSVNFSYKGNKIGSNEVGGVCLDNIVSSTGGTPIKKTFEYNSAYGINFISEQYYFSRSISVIADGAIFANYTASSDLGVNINLNDRSVVYTDVTEYLGDQTTNTGKIVHKYDNSQLCTNLSLDYLLTPAPLYLTYVNWNYGPFGFIQNDFKYGEVPENETNVYDSSNNLKKTIKKYYTHSNLEAIKGLSVSLVVSEVNYHQKNGHYNLSTYTINQLAQKLDSVVSTVYDSNHQNPLVSRERYLYNTYLLPISISSTDSKGVSIETRYTYPTSYYWGSTPTYNGEALRFQQMVERNMINIPVENTSLKNNQVIGSELTLFDLKNNIIVPKESYSLEFTTPFAYPFAGLSYTTLASNQVNFSKSNDYKLHEQYQDYDSKGNLIQATGRDGITTSYIWSYNQTLPIAKLTGGKFSSVSTLSEASYIGFESNEKTDNNPNNDYWSVNRTGQSFTTVDPKVGQYTWNMTTEYGPTRRVKPASQTCKYTFSGWAKTPTTYSGSCYFVLSAENSSGATLTNGYATVSIGNTSGQWKYFEVSLNLANVSPTIATVSAYPWKVSGSDVTVDELRLQPSDSQMETYSYIPLVGISSRTDAKSISETYVYDTFGRLKLIKNSDGHIKNRNTYNYKQ